MDNSLINPNQLRYYGIKVQGKPMLETAISTITEDNKLCTELAMVGTVIYAETFTPYEQEIHHCPQIILSSPNAWNPRNVVFPRVRRTLEEEMGTLRHVSAMDSMRGDTENEYIIEDMVFIIEQINRKISSLKRLELGKPRIYPGTSDVLITHTFQSSDRHSDVTAQDLSKRWGISISTTTNTLKKTTQKLLSSAVLPASRRYRTDQVFTRKTL